MHRIRLFVILGTGIGVVAIVLIAYSLNIFAPVELNSVDSRFKIRGDQPQPQNIVLVAVDARTFSALPQYQWPYPRTLHAKVIDRLRMAGAKVVAYDMQFTEKTRDQYDIPLVRAVTKATQAGTKVVLATTEVRADGATRVLGGGAPLKATGAEPGNALFSPDSGGIIRRVPYSTQKLKSFSIVAAEQATGKQINPNALGGDTAWVDFIGPAHRIKQVSFSDVLAGRVPTSVLKNSIIVVGTTAPTLHDIAPTSTSSAMPGPEIQANAIATALDNFPLQPTPSWVTVVLIIGLGIACSLIALWLGPFYALFSGLGLAVLYTVIVQLAFNQGIILPYVYPLGALLLGTLGALDSGLALNVFEKRRIRDVFARFVPEPVVDQVLANTGETLRLGGEQRLVTVMFCDIRGFTTVSEGRSPEEVIDFLNKFLTKMSDVVMNNGGTLVSYLGDGLMAVFGAPLRQDDHAERAVTAAKEMTGTALQELNQEHPEILGGKILRIGVGLNSGEVLVGNVGSERRLDYTAIGDTVNTASRLEGMTKGTPYRVFVGQSTYDLLGESNKDDELVFVDELAVRGRSQPVRVWGLREESELSSDEKLSTNEELNSGEKSGTDEKPNTN